MTMHPTAIRVDQNATARQIQKAFRNVSLVLHPDKNPSPTAADEFRRIANAYEVTACPRGCLHGSTLVQTCLSLLSAAQLTGRRMHAQILNDNGTRSDYDYALAHPREHMLNYYRFHRNRWGVQSCLSCMLSLHWWAPWMQTSEQCPEVHQSPLLLDRACVHACMRCSNL